VSILKNFCAHNFQLIMQKSTRNDSLFAKKN